MNYHLTIDRLRGWFRWLQGEIAYYVMVGGNRLLNHSLDLNVTTTYNLDDLLRQSYDLAYANHQIAHPLAELEECQSERDALTVKVALLNLRYEAEAIGYEMHWLREGEGEEFTLVGGDEPLMFKQSLDDIGHALEIVLHDAAEIAKSEVQA